MGFSIFMFGLLAISAKYVVASEKVVMCYYGTWATYRWGLGKFDVEDLNVDLCSHIVYSFVGINSVGTVVSLDSNLDFGRDNFGKFNALKQKNPNLKTILAVGGWNEGSAKYSIMAANPTLRQNFITSALKMLLDYGFDGFDLDWEYPGRRDTVHGSADIQNFSQLVKELKKEFKKYGLLLSAAVSAMADGASLSYDIPEISKYLDFIGLMSYDMYGAWDPVTGHNAPLHKGEGDENTDRISLYTVDLAVEYWLGQGCPPEKLLIGVPFYGRTFTLANANVNGVRAPTSGAGIAGPYTVTSGFLGYSEFCDILSRESWEIRFDNLAKVPYAVQGRNWVSYDDADSIEKKAEYGLQKKLGGVMLWSIETDDFHGICSGEDFPLLRAINRGLGRNVDGTDVTTESTTISTEDIHTDIPYTTSTVIEEDTPVPTVDVDEIVTESTTESLPEEEINTPEEKEEEEIAKPTEPTDEEEEIAKPTEPTEEFVCKNEGFAANPTNCSTFYMCIEGVDGELIPKLFECPEALYWDANDSYCNYAHLVKCSV